MKLNSNLHYIISSFANDKWLSFHITYTQKRDKKEEKKKKI